MRAPVQGASEKGSSAQRVSVLELSDLELPALVDSAPGASVLTVPGASLAGQKAAALPKASAHFPMTAAPSQAHASPLNQAPLALQSPEAEAAPAAVVPVPGPLQKASVPVQALARHAHAVVPGSVPGHLESSAPFRASSGDDTNSTPVWERSGEVPEETAARPGAGRGSPGSRSEPGPSPAPGSPSRRPARCTREQAQRRSRHWGRGWTPHGRSGPRGRPRMGGDTRGYRGRNSAATRDATCRRDVPGVISG